MFNLKQDQVSYPRHVGSFPNMQRIKYGNSHRWRKKRWVGMAQIVSILMLVVHRGINIVGMEEVVELATCL